MKNLKKFLALGMAAAMAVGITACGGTNSSANANANETKAEGGSDETSAEGTNTGAPRDLTIGSWYVQYYDSTHTSLEDDPNYAGDLAAELKFNNVKKIEKKYNVTLKWVNLTYTGTRESINNSIVAGTPDCDIYLVDTSMAVPAQANGLCTDLKEVLPADDDLFTDQNNVRYIDLGDGKACIISRVEKQKTVEATYPLAFNVQLLKDAGLEDPRDLWEKGEWTWDKFNEYCQKLTQDTDGDGAVDQYGFAGYGQEVFRELMMSNGGSIATGKKEELSSDAVGQALKEMQDLNVTYKVCYPYENDEKVMRYAYRNGNIGFWPGAAWIMSTNNDYDSNGTTGVTLQFDTAFVRWPVGPSGNKDTNCAKNAAGGEYYIIPANVEDPALVYHVLYDYWNWYDGDTSVRDSEEALSWWYTTTGKDPEYQNANFDVMYDCGQHSTLDLYESLGVEYDLESVIEGTVTPAQFQETYKQEVQDALDSLFDE